MDILKKTNGSYSLSKVLAVVSFAGAMLVLGVELLTNMVFEHCTEYLTFTSVMVGMATGRSVVDAKRGNINAR